MEHDHEAFFSLVKQKINATIGAWYITPIFAPQFIVFASLAY